MELVNDAFEKVKVKLKIELEQLDEIDTESENNAYVEVLESNGSGWICNRNASMTIDLYNDLTKEGSSYAELKQKIYQF